MKTYATNIFVSSRKVLAILRDEVTVFVAQRFSAMRDEEAYYPSRKALSSVPVWTKTRDLRDEEVHSPSRDV